MLLLRFGLLIVFYPMGFFVRRVKDDPGETPLTQMTPASQATLFPGASGMTARKNASFNSAFEGNNLTSTICSLK